MTSGGGVHRRGAVSLIIVIVAVLVVGIGYDVWLGKRSLPPALQYVPASSEAYAISGPVEQFVQHWQSVPFSRYVDALGLYSPVLRRLQDRCIKYSSGSEWKEHGIDSSRGISLAVLDWSEPRFSIAVPINDMDRFELFFQEVMTEVGRVGFKTERAEKDVAFIRITENNSNGVRFCKVVDASIVPMSPGDTVKPGEHLVAIRDPLAKNSSVGIKCVAEYVDGTKRSCTCIMNFLDDCAEPLPILATTFERGQALVARGPGNNIAATRMVDGGKAIVFVGKTAEELEGMNLHVRGQDNLTAHAADDTLRTVLRSLVKEGEEEGMSLFGAVTAPVLPLFGKVHFWMNVTNRKADIRVLVPWQTLQSSLLDTMIKNTIAENDVERPLSRWAEIRVADPSVGTYLEYARVFHNRTLEQVYGELGNISVLFRELSTLGSVGKIRIGLIGVRDGVPEIAVSLGVPQSKASEIVLKQRQVLRTTRDLALLNSALAWAPDYQGAYEPSSSDLASRLRPESHPVWGHYRVEARRQDGLTTRTVVLSEAPGANEFTNSSYDVTVGERRFEYLSPPFTDNDLKYRVADAEKESIDVEALKDGRYRLVSYYDEQAGRLVIATSVDTLERALKMGSDPEQAPISPTSKLSLRLNADWIASQVRAYPSKKLSDAERTEIIRELARYERAEVTVDALEKLSSWLVELRFAND